MTTMQRTSGDTHRKKNQDRDLRTQCLERWRRGLSNNSGLGGHPKNPQCPRLGFLEGSVTVFGCQVFSGCGGGHSGGGHSGGCCCGDLQGRILPGWAFSYESLPANIEYSPETHQKPFFIIWICSFWRHVFNVAGMCHSNHFCLFERILNHWKRTFENSNI